MVQAVGLFTLNCEFGAESGILSRHLATNGVALALEIFNSRFDHESLEATAVVAGADGSIVGRVLGRFVLAFSAHGAARRRAFFGAGG